MSGIAERAGEILIGVRRLGSGIITVKEGAIETEVTERSAQISAEGNVAARWSGVLARSVAFGVNELNPLLQGPTLRLTRSIFNSSKSLVDTYLLTGEKIEKARIEGDKVVTTRVSPFEEERVRSILENIQNMVQSAGSNLNGKS